jgi:hypothetical protein
MRDKIQGERIPLLASTHPQNDLPFTERLVIPVQLSDTGARQILLQLDSGSDGPILYANTGENIPALLKRARMQNNDDVSAVQRAFAILPQQDLRIGSRTWPRVSFVIPVNAEPSIPDREEDGLLPTVLFQRVYINFAQRYVIFDPR